MFMDPSSKSWQGKLKTTLIFFGVDYSYTIAPNCQDRHHHDVTFNCSPKELENIPCGCWINIFKWLIVIKKKYVEQPKEYIKIKE